MPIQTEFLYIFQVPNRNWSLIINELFQIYSAQILVDFLSRPFCHTVLTLKAPPIICSRRQFQILPLFQKITYKA